MQILGSHEPIDADVTTFKNLFQEKFSAEVVENSIISFNLKLSKLH